MAMSLPVQQPIHASGQGRISVALAGNPNAGKTTLFNRLTGLRAKTANFPGTTLERRMGTLRLHGRTLTLVDLPGLYGLSSNNVEETVAREALVGDAGGGGAQAAIVVVDATNLARNLYLVGQVRELGIPMVVALNMIDLADREGLSIDSQALSQQLAAPVVAVSARTGRGIAELQHALEGVLAQAHALPPVPPALLACGTCQGCRQHSTRFDWAEQVANKVARGSVHLSSARTEQLDRVLTHPVKGLLVFALMMTVFFIAMFALAQYPMGWVESAVGWLGAKVGSWLAPGDLRSFLVDGVIGGVGGVLVFLPQIGILFLFLSLLEDTGYLARAAFVMDRLMRKVGLPGKAFVPMLSAHACAIPAIMSTRVIEDRRDRLVSILILPLMSCSARLPVYAMVIALLFAGHPVVGGMVLTGAYALGIVMALVMAFLFKRTILPGESRPLVLELPTYKLPSLRNAVLTMLDRSLVFLKKAGTVILLVAIGLWALATYPKMPAAHLAAVAPQTYQQIQRLTQAAEQAQGAGEAAKAQELAVQAGALRGPYEVEYSLAGRLGKAVEPVFRPLGYDWRINVGVISSFAARETLISTLAIVYGVGKEGADDTATLHAALQAQRRADGTPVFNLATCLALLVFYVLAMQCLATQVVTRHETGTWKWPLFQLGYMSVLAYSMALVTYQILSRLAPG
jgi:ferrous iron transport protein B